MWKTDRGGRLAFLGDSCVRPTTAGERAAILGCALTVTARSCARTSAHSCVTKRAENTNGMRVPRKLHPIRLLRGAERLAARAASKLNDEYHEYLDETASL